MAAPYGASEDHWQRIVDLIAWRLARIVFGFEPVVDSWQMREYLMAPVPPGRWARAVCTNAYVAYDKLAAGKGEDAALARLASDPHVDAAFDGLEPEAVGWLSGTLRADAVLEWVVLPEPWRVEWAAAALPRRRRPRVWASPAAGPSIAPQIGMPVIGNPPTIGVIDASGRYVIKPRKLGPFQPGTLNFP